MNRIIFSMSAVIAITLVISALILSAPSVAPDENAIAGYQLWRTYGCESCHTLFGQGGNYAPDLTQIYTLRGDAYIQDFMVNPAAYHPNERLMPRFTINQSEISQLIAMLEWTSDNQDVALAFPPNPIQVNGTGSRLMLSSNSLLEVEGVDPTLQLGQQIYSQRCASCHSIADGVTLVGPSFWDIANRAATRIDGDDAATYIRNSILYPSDYIVDGFQDVMAKNLAEILSSDEIDAVIAYLLTFDASGGQS